MLKKLLTGCLTIAMAAAMTLPTMAAEMSGKVGGRAVADITSSSSVAVVKDATTGKYEAADPVSKMDMIAQGRIAYTLSAVEGDWTGSGTVEFRSGTGNDSGTEVVVLQKYVKLENDAFALSLGTMWNGFVYLTPYMGTTDAFDRYCYNCGSMTYAAGWGTTLRDERLMVSLKEVGLSVFYTQKVVNVSDSDDVNSDGIQDTVTATNIGKTAFGLNYNGNFGPVAVAAGYQTWTLALIDNASQLEVASLDYKSGAEAFADMDEAKALDGMAFTEMSLAARYAIAEGMFGEFDYESASMTAGNSGAKTATQVTMGLAFAMAFSETQGIAAAVDQTTFSSGKDKDEDTLKTLMTFTFNQKIGGIQAWVGYNSATTTDEDWEDAATSSTIAFGSRIDF